MGFSRVSAGWASPPFLPPFPTRSTVDFLWSPSHHPQGQDQLQRFVWACLFSPFLHHGLEGLAVQSPPVAGKLKVTLKGDSCYRAALPVPGVLRRHGHALSPLQGEVPNTERVLGPSLVKSGART